MASAPRAPYAADGALVILPGEALATESAYGGRYSPIRLLATGGMAEIYLARQVPSSTDESFEKDVVIKRLKPALARDRRVYEMFMDEARIGAQLNHPNIVHVYDVGAHEGVPFIAMEYIVGEELNVLCRRGLEAGNFLPLAHAIDLVRQAAVGMGYFHARRDAAGQSLGVVHCDISPTNLLVTEDGGLKVIDFGIARARGRHRDEQALPGKLSYMSPEQAARGRLDARSDVFSLGVVLYEITLGRRLFKGPAHEVYQRLLRCEIQPPTFVKREFPGHLESIIMRALEREPDERYETGYQLADALDDFLQESKLRSGPVRIARYLDDLLASGGGERRPELAAEAAQVDDQLDFDRGMFEGYRAAGGAGVAQADAWDEFEEPSQVVADVLGVDVSLVKTAGHSTERPPSNPGRAPSNPGRATSQPRPAEPDGPAVVAVPGSAPASAPAPSPLARVAAAADPGALAATAPRPRVRRTPSGRFEALEVELEQPVAEGGWPAGPVKRSPAPFVIGLIAGLAVGLLLHFLV